MMSATRAPRPRDAHRPDRNQKSGRPRRPPFRCLRFPLDSRPIATDEADDPQEQHRADKRRNEADDQSTAADAKDRREEPTTDERTDDADDDVHQDSVAVTAHDPPGQRSRETADDQEHDKLHDFLLPMKFGYSSICTRFYLTCQQGYQKIAGGLASWRSAGRGDWWPWPRPQPRQRGPSPARRSPRGRGKPARRARAAS